MHHGYVPLDTGLLEVAPTVRTQFGTVVRGMILFPAEDFPNDAKLLGGKTLKHFHSLKLRL